MKRPRGTVSLARALSKLGIASRTEAARLIRDGRVAIDGETVRDPATPVAPERIHLTIDGVRAGRVRWLTILLHKPRGVVTTSRDPQGRPTVMDLVAGLTERVFPVGRLDVATTGLLLLTNDSRFGDWLTDPRNHVTRTYVVTVRGELTDVQREELRAGIEIAGEALRARDIVVRKRSARETHVTVELTEGKNREIRRLFAAVGHDVTRLKRVALGGLALGSLPPGKWRKVSREEAERAFPRAPLRRVVRVG